MASISLIGYINNLKRYNNDDGSAKIYFSLSCKTNDPKRWGESKERDYWSVDLYVPASRSKFADYLVDGKLVGIGGVPYKSKKESTEYANVRADMDQIELLPSGNSDNRSEGGNSTPAREPRQQARTGQQPQNQQDNTSW